MIIYFRTYAKEIGCENVAELGDLAVWNYIQEYQSRITIWERQNDKTKAWAHNHIENGWTDSTLPTPNCPLQERSWKGGTWRGIAGHITSDHEVKKV